MWSWFSSIIVNKTWYIRTDICFLSLNVYLTEKDFKSGKQYMNVRYEMIDLNKKSNIKDDMENYQLYIDDELIEEYHCS